MNVLRASLTLLASTLLMCSVASAGTYTVRAGDTLYRIAQAHGMSTQQLMSLNGLQNTTIEIGQTLQVSGNAQSNAQTSAPASTAAAPRASGANANITAASSRYLGIRYVYGATGRGGVDCSSYTQLVFRSMGINIPRTTSGQWRTGYAVSSRNLRAGDLVFFNTTGRGVSHVGIYLGNDRMANANSYYGRSMIEPLFSNSYWASRYIGARRVI